MSRLRQGFGGAARVAAEPQIEASDPDGSAFVTANAGAGKTWTLVARVARLLLRGAEPDTILCVTYTKAAAAEMQTRLFEVLGGWAIAEDAQLHDALRALDEQVDDLARARRLFARALETPGGLKIQTIHAFCELLLKRFPLEADVSPTFLVLEEIAAADVAADARDRLAELALDGSSAVISAAYDHFSVELDFRSFNKMFADFAARRVQISAYAEACGGDAGWRADVWKRCGFDNPVDRAAIEAEALAETDWSAWRRAVQALSDSTAKTDQERARAMGAVAERPTLAGAGAAFSTKNDAPLKSLSTQRVDPGVRSWLVAEQTRLRAASDRAKSAGVARDTEHALTLALAFDALYAGEKSAINGLDFEDLVERVGALIKTKPDAAWVLYKLDRGIEHVLLDEAQDTAPEQWDILRDLTEEFFSGAGRPREAGAAQRTLFAVGDVKQSIYSFQGAHPERLPEEAADYRRRVEAAGQVFVEAELEASHRSTPEVLAFVDAVFADPDAAAGLSPGRGPAPPHHRPLRAAGFGAVDLWPPLESDPNDAVTEWWTPVDVRPGETGAKKLAKRTARTIKGMIDDRLAVLDKETKANRPASAGDFLILVRRRSALFDEIIRALKAAGVPSGGADRLALSEHIAFKDLVALGRFARFPDDDLTLAALMRSPFCDVDEDSLLALAHGRERSLWGALIARAGEREEWRAARDLLDWVRTEAETRPPFDLYTRVLSRLDPRGRSMRERLFGRLGREAEDAIEAFLGEALNLERRRIHDLERFLDAMAKTELEVKREPEQAAGEVRVMTVHGAKGLEAPIVILPDTTTKASAQGGPLLDAEGGGFLWSARKTDDGPASRRAREARDDAIEEETLRLFYVAMTRARDRLIVAGVAKKQKGSWYDYAERALGRPEIAHGLRVLEGEALTRFGADPAPAPITAGARRATADLPAWARKPAPAEGLIVRYAQPSTLADSEAGPAPSPLAARLGLGRFRRGILVHRLLQLLPDLPESGRASAAMRLLAREPDLTDEQRREMADAALAVLADERFAAVFGPGSRAEVAVAGGASSLPATLKVSGRIDRLVVAPDRVLVVDFKSNRPAPERIEDADPAYLTQMALYVAVLEEVFPGRAIEAALVWTDGPKLMAVPENMVRQTLARLKTEG